MFYSHSILAKSGPFAHVWLAATWEKKLTRSMIFNTDIATAVESIVNPSAPLALRLSANLLVAYLMNDCNEAMVKIRMAFRGGVVDLPEENAVANFDELDLSFEMNAPFGGGVGGGGDGGADEWAAAATTQNLGNARDISLAGSEMDDDSLAGSRSQELGGAPFSAGGGSRRFTDASSIEMMRGVDDAEGRFSGVGGRDSFLGGANEEDLGMTDLEPVAQADLLPPDLPEDDFAPARAGGRRAHVRRGAARCGSLGPVVDDLGAITGGAMDVDDEPPPPAGDDAEEAAAPEPAKKKRKPAKRAVDLRDAATQLDAATIKGWMKDRSAIVRVKRPRDAAPAAPAFGAPGSTRRDALGGGARGRAALANNAAGDAAAAAAEAAPAAPRFSAQFGDDDDDSVEVGRFESAAAPEPGAPESAKGDLLDAGSDAPRFGEDDYDLPPPDFEAGDYAPRPDDDDDLLGPPPDDDGDAGFLQPIDDEDLPAPDDFDRSGAQDRDWHPNTIKVVGLLRDQLDAAESLSFDAFTAGANKRSAVGVFVELLHLKTWDFVQLDQPAAYGDITVSKAAHFHDPIPQAVAA
ncbi:hypothetical protein JL720_9054 [Aureococcus anophagefferens]|nr:hypothetical protein JL720_9054 [Aureococcus anophagefferens]